MRSRPPGRLGSPARPRRAPGRPLASPSYPRWHATHRTQCSLPRPGRLGGATRACADAPSRPAGAPRARPRRVQGVVFMPYLTQDQLRRALTLADLTDPAYGPHCMQQLVAGATDAPARALGLPGARAPRQPRGRRGGQLRRAGLSARRAGAREPLHALRRRRAPAAQPDLGGRPLGAARSWPRRRPTTCSCARRAWSTGATPSTACTSASPTSSTCGASRARHDDHGSTSMR